MRDDWIDRFAVWGSKSEWHSAAGAGIVVLTLFVLGIGLPLTLALLLR